MTAAYADAQRRRRGSSSERISQGGLTERDKAKTFFDEPHGILGCRHYRRGAKLQCSTCNHWATCRYCHDEEEDHKLIRLFENAPLTYLVEKKLATCCVCIAQLPKKLDSIASIAKSGWQGIIVTRYFLILLLQC